MPHNRDQLNKEQPIRPDDPPAIEVKAVSHVYADSSRRREESTDQSAKTGQQALTDINLQVPEGEMFGILGPNGGGKTTLFRIIATILRATEGQVRVFGDDVKLNPAAVRRHLGVVFQNAALDVKLTAQENLHHHGRLYGLSSARQQERIDQGLDQFGLTNRRHDLVEQFSGGMRRRLELAKALLHQPRLLLLDEPAAALDPAARFELWQHLEALRTNGVTILMTTHLLEAADRCDRLALIDSGRMIACNSPANLKAILGGQVIILHATGNLQELRHEIDVRFGPWSNGGNPKVTGDQIRFERPEGATLIPLIHEAFGDRIQSATVGQPTLEDVFLHLTGHTEQSLA